MTLLTANGSVLNVRSGYDYWRDDFERGATDQVVELGNGWTDFASVLPADYDPVGILNGKVVTRALERSTAAGLPWAPDPPPGDADNYKDFPGTIIPGICGAWRDIGTPFVRVRIRWTGDWAEGHHTEAAPMVCINPDSDLLGFGAWPVDVADTPVFGIGGISRPPEDFAPVDFQSFSHVDGTDRYIDLYTNLAGTSATLWLDGVQISTAVNGLNPIPIPAELQGSTLHGFAHDQHMVAYGIDGFPSLANLQASPSITEISITSR
jgi:hypothetical protein